MYAWKLNWFNLPLIYYQSQSQSLIDRRREDFKKTVCLNTQFIISVIRHGEGGIFIKYEKYLLVIVKCKMDIYFTNLK